MGNIQNIKRCSLFFTNILGLFILIVFQGQGCSQSGFGTASMDLQNLSSNNGNSVAPGGGTPNPTSTTIPTSSALPTPDWNTDGSLADVQAKINSAAPGDIIGIPAGTFTWGAGGQRLYVNKAIILQGAGDATVINISSAGPTWTSGLIQISAAATVRNFKAIQSGMASTTLLSAGSSNGWRISAITYQGGATSGYFVYAGSYGLIDNCNITGGGGSNELIFSRGPSNSWQTPSSMGTENAVYIEDCVFNGPGYVSDFNSNSRAVVRYNTINGPMKIDGHGVASNTPARSVRHVEIYRNHWTQTTGYYAAIEIRGGTGVIFDNVGDNPQGDWFYLTDYGYLAQWPNFGSVFQTPSNYPIKDQIGVGMDPKVAGSEPLYVFNNTLAGKPWKRTLKTVAAGAISLYGSSFTETDLVRADRDFFWEVPAFDGSSGVGQGTLAQMNSITPTKIGVGFWVTDQGHWNLSSSGNQGLLYVWNGAAWELQYTPYVYPHPLRN